MKPFLVPLVGKVLSVLRYVTVFPSGWLRPRFSKESWGAVVESWVLFNLFAALTFLFMFSTDVRWLIRIAIIYSSIRLAEIMVFQFNSQFFGGYPGKKQPRLHYTVLSYRRSIFIACILYVESALWYAFIYRMLPVHHFHGGPLGPIKALYFSIVTLATIGYGDIYPESSVGHALVILEAMSGLFMTLGILAKVVSYLPRPKTLDTVEIGAEVKDRGQSGPNQAL